ncbi:hypothetical protein DFH29DRAFT_815938 [Suillus ampliporus]|nr:hypothetical protein DFH29DRAFT_815938 [Suillus ampliporus]
MTRAKGKVSKAKAPIPIAEASPKKRRKGAQPAESTTLPAINKIKEQAKHQHKHAQATRKSYDGYVMRGQQWLKTHFNSGSTRQQDGESLVVAEDSDAYEDPTFREALERIPNLYSDKALALLISYKCFHEDCGVSTCDGLSAAFKKLWEESAGDTYRGKWHYSDPRQRWEGNPVCSAEVQDIIKSVRHKANSDGNERTHSIAMTKGHMDRILAWTETICPQAQYISLISAISTGNPTPTEKTLTLKSRTLFTRVLMNLAFSSTCWNLWTRTSTLTSRCSCQNRKGWQRKVDKGVKEADLRCNRYNLYPQPDMLSCDCFFWLLLWLTFLESVHYGRPLDPEDYVFPSVSTNGVIQPHEHISHDTVQAWINEATTAAGIPRGPGDSFTTHTYRRGGAQWRWMFAPIGKRWTLARVRWWGSWAENENRNTLIRYLLDELHSYESDHSDALCPTQQEADGSLLGEHTLAKPVCTQDLQMMQECITADVAVLRSDVRRLATAFVTHSTGSEPWQQSFTPSSCPAPPLHPSTQPLSQSPHTTISSSRPPVSTRPPSGPVQSLSQITCNGTNGFRPLPEKGLLIPDLPPQKGLLEQIIQHWLKGDPACGLHLPLRDWPGEWIRGKNKDLFATKYKQRSVIALEFLERYDGNEAAFMAAYPEADDGHTALLRAINRARRARGDILPRK